DPDIATLLALQLRNEVPEGSVGDRGVLPWLGERARSDDVLADLVDEGSEGLDVAAGPVLGPVIVGPATEKDEVLIRDDAPEILQHHIVEIEEEADRTLCHPIKGKQLVEDDLTHNYSLFHANCAHAQLRGPLRCRDGWTKLWHVEGLRLVQKRQLVRPVLI